jgi:hypothetical protein
MMTFLVCFEAEYRARHMKFFVSNTVKKLNEVERYNNVTLCGSLGEWKQWPGKSVTATFECEEVARGRYVIVYKPHGRDYMNFCEVEVYGPNTFCKLPYKVVFS